MGRCKITKIYIVGWADVLRTHSGCCWMNFTDEQSEASSCKVSLKAAAGLDNLSGSFLFFLQQCNAKTWMKTQEKSSRMNKQTYFGGHMRKTHRWAAFGILSIPGKLHWSTHQAAHSHPETANIKEVFLGTKYPRARNVFFVWKRETMFHCRFLSSKFLGLFVLPKGIGGKKARKRSLVARVSCSLTGYFL